MLRYGGGAVGSRIIGTATALTLRPSGHGQLLVPLAQVALLKGVNAVVVALLLLLLVEEVEARWA